MSDHENLKSNGQDLSSKRKNRDYDDLEANEISSDVADTDGCGGGVDVNLNLSLWPTSTPPKPTTSNTTKPSLPPQSPPLLPHLQGTPRSLQLMQPLMDQAIIRPLQQPLTPSSPLVHDPAHYGSPPYIPYEAPMSILRPQRARRNPTQRLAEGKSETIPPPYPWATNKRATVHTLDYLRSKRIEVITGEIQCKRCEEQYEMAFNLNDTFRELWEYMAGNKEDMNQRAPAIWMNPVLPNCKFCNQENSMKPVISDKKKSINWLFLFLGQMLGCCTLDQLKYFCKHTKNHRTGAKDRVLFLAYLTLCKQLDPNGPFNLT